MCQTFGYLIKLYAMYFFLLEHSIFMSFDFSEIYIIISSYKSKQIIWTNKEDYWNIQRLHACICLLLCNKSNRHVLSPKD